MRKEARKILFETLKFQGSEEVLFSTGKVTDQSALIETVIDAMEKFKNLHIHAVISNEVKLFCRLHSMRKNCREYRNNKNSCKTCPHFVEAK
jgi:2-iminoacetate synthase ThiH